MTPQIMDWYHTSFAFDFVFVVFLDNHLWSRPPALARYRIYDDVGEGPWSSRCDVLAR